MGRVYGYVRISSRDQNEARQMAAMREAGVSDRDIYLDKRSGADFERQGYRQLLRRLRAGDTLIVKSIDRLGRNYDEILEQWRIITREKCASILVLDMPLLDSTISGLFLYFPSQIISRISLVMRPDTDLTQTGAKTRWIY